MKNNKQKVVIITGPTSVGKTALGVLLAKKYDGEVVSADSIQIYKGFDIGSAKVTKDEMQGIPHYLIDERDPRDEYSAGDFAREASGRIDDITSRGKLPIIVGGTGLYVNALLFPLDADCSRDEEYRASLMQIAEREGKEKLHEMLSLVDSVSAGLIHPNQLDRVVRALEIFHLTGVPKSGLMKKDKESKYDYLLLVLVRDRAEVYAGIEKRAIQMIQNGLEREVRGLLDSGVPADAPAMKGIGYKEMIEFIQGETTLDKAVEEIKKHTRNYAKRQLTYFKKMDKAIFVPYNNIDHIEKLVEKFLGDEK